MDDRFLFYVPPKYIHRDDLFFPEEEVHHLVNVLRKRSGDIVQVTDGLGCRMDTRLEISDDKAVKGHILASYYSEAGPDRVLAMGVIRNRDRLEFAVEKATELGVTRIVLVHSEFAGKMDVKSHRIDKTIRSALKQSRQLWLPAWEESASFIETITRHRDHRTILAAHPSGENIKMHEMKDSSLLLLVGPEGGFSENEMKEARANNAIFVRLGENRLRTETAVCALMALTGNR